VIPIEYQVVGEEDYAFHIRIDRNGEYLVDSGTYTSQEPRKGRLAGDMQDRLLAAVKDLGLPRDHPLPEGSTAFMAQLTVGEEGEAATYSFWEGAIEQDAPLKTLVRLLDLL
jgi:hypothetical protein